MRHGLVEADVFEHFDPGQEDGDADDDVELILPVAQEREVIVLAQVAVQQIIQEGVHLYLSVDIEHDARVGQGKDQHVQAIHQRLEVRPTEIVNLSIGMRRKESVQFLIDEALTSMISSMV